MHVIYKTPKQENLHYVDHTFYQGHVDAFLHADIYIIYLHIYYEFYQIRKLLYFIIIDGWSTTFKLKHIFRVHKSSVLYHNFSLFINKQAKNIFMVCIKTLFFIEVSSL